MKVSFYENTELICTWENPVCIPVINDSVVLETETDKSIIKNNTWSLRELFRKILFMLSVNTMTVKL